MPRPDQTSGAWTPGDGRDVVLHVMGCPSVQYGTFEDNLVSLAAACSERGWSCWFVYPGELAVPEFGDDIEAAGGRVVVVEETGGGSVAAFRALYGLIREASPIAVHAHFGRIGYMGALAARLAGVPRILLTKHHESWPEISRGHALALRLLSVVTDEMVCVSPVVEDEVLTAGVSESKVRVVEFGVNPERYAPDPEARESVRREEGLAPDARIVLCVSHLREPKGVDVLLEAWGDLDPDPASTVLLVAGEGELGEELRAQAAASPASASIRFLGHRHDVARLLAACDAFVCPSLSEAGGLNILEALSAGAPIATTKVGVARGLADHSVLVPVSSVDDPQALADAIARLLDDESLRSDLSARARERAVESHSIAGASSQLVELYDADDSYMPSTTEDEAAGSMAEGPSVRRLAEGAAAFAAGESEVSSAASAPSHEDVREHTRDVLSRSVVLWVAKGATWALAFIMTVALPRFLGPSAFGRLYFAISFTGLFALLVEFGLNALVVREVARNKDHATRYLLNAVLVKAGLWAVAVVAIVVVMRVADYPMETRITVLILTVSMLISSLSTSIVSVLQAADRFRWISVSSVAEKAVYVGLGVAALALGYNVIAVALAILVGALTGLLLDLYWLFSLSKQIPLHGGWQGLEVRLLFRRALPFFSVVLFGAVYFRIDVLMLSIMKSDTVVGWYGAAYRLFETTNFIPEAFLLALAPMVSRLAVARGRGLAMMAQKSLDLLMLGAFPLAMGTFVLADEIITTLYGASGFAASAMILRVLSVGVVLMYANGVFTQLLIATERQKKLAVTAGVAAVTNFTLNLLLIPSLGAVGAALTTVFTEGLVMTLNFVFLPRGLTRQLRPVTPLKALLASGVMAVPLVFLNGQNLVFMIVVGVVSYVVAVRVLRALPADDWKMMKSALLRLRTT